MVSSALRLVRSAPLAQARIVIGKNSEPRQLRQVYEARTCIGPTYVLVDFPFRHELRPSWHLSRYFPAAFLLTRF